MAVSSQSKLKRFFTHPILAMFVVIVLCRGVKDFYPLNSFPMYAEPGQEKSVYVIVANEHDEPIAIRPLTGETAAKVGKKYISTRNSLATRAGVKKADEAPQEICEQAWQRVVDGLRHLAKRRRKELPAVVRLKIVEIYQDKEAFREEPTLTLEAR